MYMQRQEPLHPRGESSLDVTSSKSRRKMLVAELGRIVGIRKKAEGSVENLQREEILSAELHPHFIRLKERSRVRGSGIMRSGVCSIHTTPLRPKETVMPQRWQGCGFYERTFHPACLRMYLKIRIGNESRHQARRFRRASVIHALREGWVHRVQPKDVRHSDKSADDGEKSGPMGNKCTLRRVWWMPYMRRGFGHTSNVRAF